MTAKPDTSFGIKVSKKDFTKPNGAINSKWIVKNLQILFDNNAIINLTGHRVLEITDANISETQKLEGATANFIRYSAKRVSDEYSIPGASVGDVVHGSVLVIQEDSGALWTRGGHTFHGPYIDNMVSQDAQMSGMTYIVEIYVRIMKYAKSKETPMSPFLLTFSYKYVIIFMRNVMSSPPSLLIIF